MGTTTKGIWFPDASTPLSPLHTNFATLASSVDAAIPFDKEVVKDFATTAARDAAIGTPANGQRCRVNNVPMQYLAIATNFYAAGWYTEQAIKTTPAVFTTVSQGTVNTDFGKMRMVGGKLNRTTDASSFITVTTGFSQYVLAATGGCADTTSSFAGPCTYEAGTDVNNITFRVFHRAGNFVGSGVTFSFQFMAWGF